MKIILHSTFIKQYKKLKAGKRKRFKERRDLFVQDQFHPILNNHPLAGKYKGHRSINVGGNLRVVYTQINKTTAYFITIDTHSNLYS